MVGCRARRFLTTLWLNAITTVRFWELHPQLGSPCRGNLDGTQQTLNPAARSAGRQARTDPALEAVPTLPGEGTRDRLLFARPPP